MSGKTNLIAVAGPTASGKTAVSIALARRFDGEIVSADSMQIYRGMEIGTAAPTPEEQSAAIHHGIGILSPTESFSAAAWRSFAMETIDEIVRRGHLPIICGGTGLYLDTLTKIGNYAEASAGDEKLRAELFDLAEKDGNPALHAILAELDPEAAAQIHPNNVKRVVRAIEICKTTGRTKTEIDRAQLAADSPVRECRLLLCYHDRALLYDRINRRVGQMLSDGLVEEAKRVLGLTGDTEPSQTALQAIGYKELLPYFHGEISLAEAADAIRQSSRNYAKRQMTWFRRSRGYRLYCDTEQGEMRPTEDIFAEAYKVTAAFLRDPEAFAAHDVQDKAVYQQE